MALGKLSLIEKVKSIQLDLSTISFFFSTLFTLFANINMIKMINSDIAKLFSNHLILPNI